MDSAAGRQAVVTHGVSQTTHSKSVVTHTSGCQLCIFLMYDRTDQPFFLVCFYGGFLQASKVTMQKCKECTQA